MMRKGGLSAICPGIKIARSGFERLTGTRTGMANILDGCAAKIQRKRKCTTHFAKKMTKYAVKHIFRAFSERFSERLGEIYP